MTWQYAKRDAAVARKVVAVDGYLVGYCQGVNDEDGLVRVLVTDAHTNRKPTAMIVENGICRAVVRGNYVVAEQFNPLVLYRGGARAYFTLDGWVDEWSNPLLIPWEITGDGYAEGQRL